METINIENVAKEYQKIRLQQELLAIQEQELKTQIIEFMKSEDIKNIDGKYGNFTYSTRITKTIDDPVVKEKENELKSLKEMALQDGKYTEKVSDVLTYKANK